MSYRFLEHVATADIAFEARGKTLEEVFTAAAEATMNVMIESLDSIAPRQLKEFELENADLDMLLFDFLQELIFFKDSETLLLRVTEITIEKQKSSYKLKALTQGEPLDTHRHKQRQNQFLRGR